MVSHLSIDHVLRIWVSTFGRGIININNIINIIITHTKIGAQQKQKKEVYVTRSGKRYVLGVKIILRNA